VSAFAKTKKVKRMYLSLIKLVYKEMGYNMQRAAKKENGVVIPYYIIIKE
jgi:hypothetical protein